MTYTLFIEVCQPNYYSYSGGHVLATQIFLCNGRSVVYASYVSFLAMSGRFARLSGPKRKTWCCHCREVCSWHRKVCHLSNVLTSNVCVTLFSMHGGGGFWSFKIQINLLVGTLTKINFKWILNWADVMQGDELSTQEQTWSHCSSWSEAKVVVFQIFLVYLVLFCYSTSNLYLCNSGWLVKHDTTSCYPPLQIKNGSTLVYLPSLISQIIYSCLNELYEQMEVLCRLCEYQVIL